MAIVKIRLFITFILIVIYIILNIIIAPMDLAVDLSQYDNNAKQYIVRGAMQQDIGISDSVSAIVTKNKFYGKIIQRGVNTDLYLFKILRMPLKRQGINFYYLHILFVFLISTLLFLSFERRKPQYENLPTDSIDFNN
jgi:hypothetical protein